MGTPRTDPEDVFMRELGKRLHRVRKTRGLTLTKLGQMTGFRYQDIQKYEVAETRVSVFRLIHLARALNVPPSYLMENYTCLDSKPSESPSRQS